MQPVGAGHPAQRLLNGLLETLGGSLVQDDLQRHTEHPLCRRYELTHRLLALSADGLGMRVGPVRLDEEVLEPKAFGQVGLRAQGVVLAADLRDVDSVEEPILLARELKQRDEHAGLGAVW